MINFSVDIKMRYSALKKPEQKRRIFDKCTLDSTYGITLITLFLENILYGCGLLQTWLYFHWYPKDHWGIKMMVILLAIFETLQITLVFAGTYRALITDFGNILDVWAVTWTSGVQMLAGYLSAFTVQLYFAYCLYILNRNQKFAPILIVVLALTSIGAGLAETIMTLIRLRLLLRHDTLATVLYVLQSAATLACDIAITVSLLWTLGGRKNQNVLSAATNNVLDRLMVNAINRGVLTALCAAITIIMSFSLPGTFWSFMGQSLSGKLYMNSALASLNSRQYIKERAYLSTDSNNWHLPLADLSSVPAQFHRDNESQTRPHS